jgi:phosphocarrier protein HPr
VTRRIVTVPNELGLHMRAANVFVERAGGFRARVLVSRGDLCVNGKSIMGLMMLAAAKGTTVKFIATGNDAPQMLAELEALFAKKFDEA